MPCGDICLGLKWQILLADYYVEQPERNGDMEHKNNVNVESEIP